MQWKLPNIQHHKTAYGLLLGVILLSHWFFLAQIVSLKDDNSFFYLPVRVYLSDALHKGIFPFWNPYLMNGVPIHCDTQGAIWNPIAFVLALCFHYNHTWFLIEYLLYIAIGAIGFYKLLQLLIRQPIILLTASIVYSCNGFVSGVANFITWTASLAFMPWVFYAFFKLIQQPSLKNVVKFSLAVWLLLTTGYPGFAIFSAYLLLGFLIAQIWHWGLANMKASKKLLLCLIGSVVLVFVLCLPALVSYAEFLPYYSRGQHLKTHYLFTDCFYPQFFSSLLLPSSVYNAVYDALGHAANRDMYIGIVPICLLFISVIHLKQWKKKIPLFIWFCVGFCFIFMFGFLTPLGSWVFHYMPLIGAIKWSSAVRIFLIVAAIVASAFALQQPWVTRTTNTTFRVFVGAMLIATITIFLYTYQTKTYATKTHLQLFLVQTCVQIVLWLYLLFVGKNFFAKPRQLAVFVCVDMLAAYTIGMAMNSVAHVPTRVYNAYIKGFYQEKTDSLLKHPLGQNQQFFTYNPWRNHNVSTILNGQTDIYSNTIFSGYEHKFYDDSSRKKELREHAFAYSYSVDSVHIDSVHLDYNKLYLSVYCKQPGQLILQQNNYFRWQQKNHVPIQTYDHCFMQFDVRQGQNIIDLTYQKGYYYLWICIAFAAQTACLIIVILSYCKRYAQKHDRLPVIKHKRQLFN